MDELIKEIKKLNKLLVLSILSNKTQTQCILSLNKVGFAQKEIADLVGTTPATVNSTLTKAKKKKSLNE